METVFFKKEYLDKDMRRGILFLLLLMLDAALMTGLNADEQLIVQRFNNFLVHLNTSPGRDAGNLVVLNSIVGGGVLFLDPDTVLRNTEDPTTESNIVPEVSSRALFYPSPFRLSEGAVLGYRLSRSDMDISIRMYDMRGNQIFRKDIPAGEQGAQIGYNRVPFNASILGHSRLSSGMYFYIILYDGKVLAKGKVGVAP